jgi:hypothetical protein
MGDQAGHGQSPFYQAQSCGGCGCEPSADLAGEMVHPPLGAPKQMQQVPYPRAFVSDNMLLPHDLRLLFAPVEGGYQKTFRQTSEGEADNKSWGVRSQPET